MPFEINLFFFFFQMSVEIDMLVFYKLFILFHFIIIFKYILLGKQGQDAFLCNPLGMSDGEKFAGNSQSSLGVEG